MYNVSTVGWKSLSSRENLTTSGNSYRSSEASSLLPDFWTLSSRLSERVFQSLGTFYHWTWTCAYRFAMRNCKIWCFPYKRQQPFTCSALCFGGPSKQASAESMMVSEDTNVVRIDERIKQLDAGNAMLARSMSELQHWQSEKLLELGWNPWHLMVHFWLAVDSCARNSTKKFLDGSMLISNFMNHKPVTK